MWSGGDGFVVVIVDWSCVGSVRRCGCFVIYYLWYVNFGICWCYCLWLYVYVGGLVMICWFWCVYFNWEFGEFCCWMVGLYFWGMWICGGYWYGLFIVVGGGVFGMLEFVWVGKWYGVGGWN